MKQRILLRSIAIIGIIFSCAILISSIYSWITASFGVFPLIIYIYIFVVANKTRRRVFLRAIIALGILTAIDILLFIFFVVTGFLLSEEAIEKYNKENNAHETKSGSQVRNFICGFIALLLAVYMTITLVFVEKARRHIFQTCHEIPVYPYGYNNDCPIVIQINGAPPRYSIVINENVSQSFSSPT